MNAMRRPTNSSLSSFAVLASSALAACSGVGQDELFTVGVRPTGDSAALGGTTQGDAGEPSVDGSDVMEQTFDGDSTTTRSGAAAGASRAPVETAPSAGSGIDAEIRGNADALPAPDAGTDVAGAGGSDAPLEDACGAIPSQPAGKATSGRVSGPGAGGVYA